MRKSYMAVLLLSLVLIGVACDDSTKNETETPTGSAEAAPTERRAGEAQVEGDPVRFVIVNDLRLRKGSGAEAEVIGELQEGDRVTLTGPQSEENYTAELRGRKVTAPWVEVETPLGKRAWVFGGALGDAPAPLGDSSAKVEAYRAYLDGLPPDNCASLNPAAEKLKQDFKGAAGAVRDAAIRAFWGYYHDAIREAAKVVYRADMEAEFETYNWESQRFSSKVAQRKADEWKICGIGMEFPEGMVTLMEAADYMYDHFYAFGSGPMQEYLKQHQRELREGFSVDGGLTISPRQLAKRLVFWDHFGEAYPDFKSLRGEAINYGWETSVLLTGLDNTPAFDWASSAEDTRLNTEWKQAYEWIMENHRDTRVGSLIEEYYLILKEEDFRRTQRVQDFSTNWYRENVGD